MLTVPARFGVGRRPTLLHRYADTKHVKERVGFRRVGFPRVGRCVAYPEKVVARSMLAVAAFVCACATPQNTVETYPGRELARQLLARDASELKDQHGDQFNDLKIVGFDPARVTSSQQGTEMRQMPLQLSARPPLEWGPLFEARYEHSFSGNKRTIRVVGAYIYVDCVPEDLAAVLEDLKPIVSQTNEAYRADLARQTAQRQKAETDAVAEKQRLEDVKKGLKFD
jgi:hypothetical protein